MTTLSYICHDPKAVAVWPDDGVNNIEHALVLRLYCDGNIGITQNGKQILVPMYALEQVIKVLREMRGK